MIAKKALFAAIAVTALIFSISLLVVKEYWLACAAFMPGLIWLTLEIYHKSPFPTLFFAFFVGIAVVASLKPIAAFIILLGLCTGLAAWDLSRFLTRLREVSETDAGALLTKKHLTKLSITLCVGYGAALLPLLFKLPMNFMALFALALLAMLALRRSILSLRPPP
jgi:hypothetical protein